ncbi:histone-like nucleoid-structuring protein Lsr2 [Williamsia serinedens]|uniref:Lsr2 protein n=1 Tax=Williamsia serinedens TaxID=391736 RepID=A0ABT1H8S9_9NOCA|nr:Lsr2 family protein [Williamsia serinedens]MCP2163030.1 Lsr2 protein [Williamsia serinedens]
MAQTVNTIYVDDLDGTEIAADQATTVAWSWRGVDYEFDTSADRLAGLESGDRAITVAQLLAASRRVSGRRAAVRPVGGSRPGNADAAEIRSWARDNGIQVPDRGRIPAPIRASYLAARNRSR